MLRSLTAGLLNWTSWDVSCLPAWDEAWTGAAKPRQAHLFDVLILGGRFRGADDCRLDWSSNVAAPRWCGRRPPWGSNYPKKKRRPIAASPAEPRSASYCRGPPLCRVRPARGRPRRLPGITYSAADVA